MTVHPRDIASCIAATEAIIQQLEASPDPEPAPEPETAASPEPDPEPAAPPQPAPPEPAPPERTRIERQDGWTPQRQARFLETLAATHNVATAAHEVGMSRQSAYKLRARLRGEPFDLAWDAAFQTAFDTLAQAAMERAINGVAVPHLHNGEVVHTSRRYDERLTIALLAMRLAPRRAHAPPWHPASAYRPDDLPALLARVADGPATWRGPEVDHDGEPDDATPVAIGHRAPHR